MCSDVGTDCSGPLPKPVDRHCFTDTVLPTLSDPNCGDQRRPLRAKKLEMLEMSYPRQTSFAGQFAIALDSPAVLLTMHPDERIEPNGLWRLLWLRAWPQQSLTGCKV